MIKRNKRGGVQSKWSRNVMQISLVRIRSWRSQDNEELSREVRVHRRNKASLLSGFLYCKSGSGTLVSSNKTIPSTIPLLSGCELIPYFSFHIIRKWLVEVQISLFLVIIVLMGYLVPKKLCFPVSKQNYSQRPLCMTASEESAHYIRKEDRMHLANSRSVDWGLSDLLVAQYKMVGTSGVQLCPTVVYGPAKW